MKSCKFLDITVDKPGGVFRHTSMARVVCWRPNLAGRGHAEIRPLAKLDKVQASHTKFIPQHFRCFCLPNLQIE
ncbi:hypothetical protein Y032_0002g1039 [Ancylostoma ceylanicum]|uniref:Uncharacterized protein n=1 Tax=Ancylostoma ceylanicum TaxID=53326 RepID=A0A016W102_9BILA|nr:hypothetical protein Y032_0002g1039 [Ancylostoma ceylanicum]